MNKFSLSSRHEEEAGFTLLELLVSILLLSFVGMIITNGIGFAARAWERVDVSASPEIDSDVSMGVIRTLIEGAYPANGENAQSIIKPAMVGDANTVTFSGPMLAKSGLQTHYRVSIKYDPLQRTVKLFWNADQVDIREPHDDLDAGQRVLFKNVSTFKIAYLSGAAPETRNWLANWIANNKLPTAISMEIGFDDAAIVQTKTWYFRPRVTHKGGCVIDPVTRSCRESQ